MQCSPLHWWDDEHLAQLMSRCIGRTQEWYQTWGVPVFEYPAIHCRRAHESLTSLDERLAFQWLPIASDSVGTAQCWLRIEKSFLRSIYLQMYQADTTQDSTIAWAFAEKTGHDWLAEMGYVLGAAIDPALLDIESCQMQLPAHNFFAWSGAIQIDISHPFDCAIHMTYAHAENLMKSNHALPPSILQKAPLVSLNHALASRQLSLTVRLNDIELNLGQIQSLIVNDIVMLQHRLDQPFTLLDQDGHALCGGYLGAHDNRQALQIISHAALNHSTGLNMNSSDTTTKVQAINLNNLKDASHAESKSIVDNANPLHSIKANLQVCVGSVSLSVGELLSLKELQVVRLDQSLNQPVEILLDHKVVARGNLVAVDGNFAVQLTELPVPLNI